MTDDVCSRLPDLTPPPSSVTELDRDITSTNPVHLPFPRQTGPIDTAQPKFSSFGSYRQRHGDPLPSNPNPSMEAPGILESSTRRGGLSIALADHPHHDPSDSVPLITPKLLSGTMTRFSGRTRSKSSDLDREMAWQRKIQLHKLEEEEERKRKELELMHQNMVSHENEGVDTEEEAEKFSSDYSSSSSDDTDDDESDDSFHEEEDDDDYDVSNEFKDKVTLCDKFDIPQVVHGVHQEDTHGINKVNEECNCSHITNLDEDGNNPRRLKMSIPIDRQKFHSARFPSSIVKSRMDVTDMDVEELEGCIDLGFGFNMSYEERSSHLKDTFPALELYYAVNKNKNFADGGMPSPMSPMNGTGTNLSRANSIESSSSIPVEETSYRISVPGDRKSIIKKRLRHWAKVVAFSLKEGL